MMLLEPFLSFPLPFNDLVFGDFYFSNFILLDALHGLGDLVVSNKMVSLANLLSALIFFFNFPFYEC